jgi:hypothetical protein
MTSVFASSQPATSLKVTFLADLSTAPTCSLQQCKCSDGPADQDVSEPSCTSSEAMSMLYLRLADVEDVAPAATSEAARAAEAAAHRAPRDVDVCPNEQQRWRKAQDLLLPAHFVDVCDWHLHATRPLVECLVLQAAH